MATFFGEVIFNPSRAYFEEDDYDDENDDETSYDRYEMESFIDEDISNSSSLIISFGSLANEFIEGCALSDGRLVGKICIHKTQKVDRIDTGDFHSRTMKSSPIFISSKGAILCQVSEDFVPKLASEFASALLSLIDKTSPVLILTTNHLSKCIVSAEERSSMFFALKSPFFPADLVLYPPLPSPAVLDSLPAAVMTECIIQDRSCVVYAGYTEVCSPGNVDLVADDFQKVISSPPFRGFVRYDRKISSRVCKRDLFDRYT